MTHKERLEQLVTQYKDVAQKASDATLLKTKLEGAIELTQAIIVEEEEEVKKEPQKEASVKEAKK
jgi:hypothetical protein|tara:strand:- start:218 stop:412 length:195 start_codon:yes stop_codon:yes gene_type:complete